METLGFFNLKDVTLMSCGNELEFKHNGQVMKTYFFNLLFFDDHVKHACAFLEEKEIELIEEPLVDNAYYIVVDGELFQKIAIDQQWARVNENYDGYLFDLSEKEIIVSTSFKSVHQENSSYLVLSILLVLWVGCTWLWRKM